ALPGDDLNAATRWATIAGVISGGGDGQLTGTYNNVLAAAPVAAEETNLFWWHLRLAGFVAGPTAAGPAAGQQPANAANGIMGVQTGSGAATLGFTSNIVCSTNLPDKIAIAVDTQMDDATYNSGQVRAILQAGPNPALRAQVAGDAYAETGTNQYTLCKGL
ncbi:MAG: prepilin-type cleavage/methylation domain-containing protein, partial [Candidatus Rokubacteria bacterium]|nr:prepilin-type cleavage/methylation domain-containing protein [Candidatus Rokubacteria bacterium]